MGKEIAESWKGVRRTLDEGQVEPPHQEGKLGEKKCTGSLPSFFQLRIQGCDPKKQKRKKGKNKAQRPGVVPAPEKSLLQTRGKLCPAKGGPLLGVLGKEKKKPRAQKGKNPFWGNLSDIMTKNKKG